MRANLRRASRRVGDAVLRESALACTRRLGYAVVNQWNNTPTSGGFQTNLTITNTGSTAINGWTLTFAFPNGQTITGLWNATIAPGAVMNSVGFNGTWSRTNARPS